MTLDPKQQQIMDFLHSRVFDPILNSPSASSKVKAGVNTTIMRMQQHSAEKMRQYFWSAIVGTDRSINFADELANEGFNRFEECLEEFRRTFTDAWLRSQ